MKTQKQVSRKLAVGDSVQLYYTYDNEGGEEWTEMYDAVVSKVNLKTFKAVCEGEETDLISNPLASRKSKTSPRKFNFTPTPSPPACALALCEVPLASASTRDAAAQVPCGAYRQPPGHQHLWPYAGRRA